MSIPSAQCHICPTLEHYGTFAVTMALEMGYFKDGPAALRADQCEHLRRSRIRRGFRLVWKDKTVCHDIERGMLHMGNPQTRALFQDLTGITLPPTNKATLAVAKRWLGDAWASYEAEKEAARLEAEKAARTISMREEAERRAALEPYERALEDFAATMSPMERGRFMKSMARLYRTDEGIFSRGRRIYDLVQQGYRTGVLAGYDGLTLDGESFWMTGRLTKAGARFAEWLASNA